MWNALFYLSACHILVSLYIWDHWCIYMNYVEHWADSLMHLHVYDCRTIWSIETEAREVTRSTRCHVRFGKRSHDRLCLYVCVTRLFLDVHERRWFCLYACFGHEMFYLSACFGHEIIQGFGRACHEIMHDFSHEIIYVFVCFGQNNSSYSIKLFMIQDFKTTSLDQNLKAHKI